MSKKFDRNLENIPLATPEQVAYIEKKLVKLCSIYFDQVATLSEKRFCVCVQRAMHFDAERGLGPGQLPHIRYIFSEEFNKWEDELWDKINARLEFVSDDFYDLKIGK